MSSGKSRLDVALVERGLFDSREKARRAVMAAEVLVDGQPATKPGTLIAPHAKIEVATKEKFVGRGGYKIEAALDAFRIDPAGRVCVDIGASTGGFTDCLLQRGAAKVFAVDVGYGQLHDKLRKDARVVVLERTNARTMNAEQLGLAGPSFELVVVDASFIGLEKLLPAIVPLMKPGAELVALVKPQFQVGREEVGKGGVVRDDAARLRVTEEVASAARALGLEVLGDMDCVIAGPEGNRERFLWARKPS